MRNINSLRNETFSSNDIIAMDTCFVLNFAGFNRDEEIENQCIEMVHNATSRNAILAVSTISMMELESTLIMATFANYNFRGERQIKRLKLENELEYMRILQEAHNTIKTFRDDFFSNPNVFEEPFGNVGNEVNEIAREIRNQYGISGVNDSVQLALCLKEGVTHFATTDKDFYSYNSPNLKILLDQRNLDLYGHRF